MKTIFKLARGFYLLTVMLAVFTLSGCTSEPAVNKEDSTEPIKTSFQDIAPEAAKQRLDSEKGIVLLDVRTKEEHDAGHIEGSLLLPVDNILQEAEKILSDKDAVIFVYCRSGNRSVTASNILVELGYKNVYNLGGIKDWPYETVK